MLIITLLGVSDSNRTVKFLKVILSLLGFNEFGGARSLINFVSFSFKVITFSEVTYLSFDNSVEPGAFDE